MVGGGINDAPALAVADVGSAMGAGTGPAAGRRGDERDPIGVLCAVALSRATVRTSRQDLV